MPDTIILFEDSRVPQLSPATMARSAHTIQCGSYRLVDFARMLGGQIQSHVRPHLRVIEKLDQGFDAFDISEIDRGDSVMMICSRLVPNLQTLSTLKELHKGARQDQIVLDGNGDVAAAWITSETVESVKSSPPASIDEWLRKTAEVTSETKFDGQVLESFSWPHDIVSMHIEHMAENLQHRIEHGNYQQREDGVFVGDGVSVGEYPVIDTSDGPIILEDNVSVGPFCFLAGPVYAGAGTRVIEHAALKDAVSLGHTVKIGGEVEASVIEPYTNKQHHGFLGHSYLGSWINLGAGTCNSDLKNTYGKINIQYGDQKVATGMQFLGCIMGDYSKTAINTSIFTGKVIGVCSMMYGFVTSNVASYVNYARTFGQTSLLPADVMVNTQKRMFDRRKVEQRACDRQLIHDMYTLSQTERQADPDLL
ncbi:MAG: putative sugar nucleotidyl transferase [Planctomycetota bacterium]